MRRRRAGGTVLQLQCTTAVAGLLAERARVQLAEYTCSSDYYCLSGAQRFEGDCLLEARAMQCVLRGCIIPSQETLAN